MHAILPLAYTRARLMGVETAAAREQVNCLVDGLFGRSVKYISGHEFCS